MGKTAPPIGMAVRVTSLNRLAAVRSHSAAHVEASGPDIIMRRSATSERTMTPVKASTPLQMAAGCEGIVPKGATYNRFQAGAHRSNKESRHCRPSRRPRPIDGVEPDEQPRAQALDGTSLSGFRNTTASGGTVSRIECCWPCQGVGSEYWPPAFPRLPPPKQAASLFKSSR